MSRCVILTLLYAGTFLLWGTIPICLFFSPEVWIFWLPKLLFISILFGFLIKKFLPQTISCASKGMGHYLYGEGYWGNSDSDDVYEDVYCGYDKRSVCYLHHWFMIILLAMAWGNSMIEISDPVAKWGRGMMGFLIFYNISMPFYGILWRSCFDSSLDKTVADTSKISGKRRSFFSRIPPIYYDIFFQWLCFYTTITVVMLLCPGGNFLPPLFIMGTVILIQIFQIISLLL